MSTANGPLVDQLERWSDQILATARAVEDNAIDHRQALGTRQARDWQRRLIEACACIQRATLPGPVAGWSPSMSGRELV